MHGFGSYWETRKCESTTRIYTHTDIHTNMYPSMTVFIYLPHQWHRRKATHVQAHFSSASA